MARIDDEIAALATMSRKELLAEWQQLHDSPAPPWSADLLRRGIAYRMHEIAYGGPSEETLRELRRLAADPTPVSAPAPSRTTSMRPGTRLLRTWRGKSYAVTATEEGFLCEGQTYASLSQVARAITGTPWSGPKFFGLGKAMKGAVSNAC